MIEPAVSLREVFCVHRNSDGDAAALQGLSLDVADGDQLCVLGPSGSGKTTMLRVIAGLQQPSAGAVTVLGYELKRVNATRLAWLRNRWIGFLHQHAETTLVPDLNLLEAVALPLALRGEPRGMRQARALELLAACGLLERTDAFPHQLSGGERQCAALCAALAHRPRLLLADEPTAELDARSAANIAQLIGEVTRANGATVVIVSHDPALAEHVTRTVRIRDGRVVEDLGGGGRSLVVGKGGWVRLPAGLLSEAGIDGSLHARAVDEGLLLTPGETNTPAAGVTGGEIGAAPQELERPIAVHLRSVTRARGAGASRRVVLDALTMSFEPGRLTVVTGRSGAGKSTLLAMLACLARPDSGELALDGRPTSGLDREHLAALRRERIGYLPQEPEPIAFLSATENVLLALALRGAGGEGARSRASASLSALNLTERAGHRVQRLSAGEAQRVALARAIASARGLLVVDEPTSRLDEDNAAAVGRLLREIAARGQTVICATHDPELIRHADRVVALGPELADQAAVGDAVPNPIAED